MVEKYFPHKVKAKETLSKIIDDSKQNINKKGLKDIIYPGQIINYQNGKLTIGEESAYKNVKLKTQINLSNFSKDLTINKGQYIGLVLHKKGIRKFDSILNSFPIQQPGDKVKINGNTIFLLRNNKIIHSANIDGKEKNHYDDKINDSIKNNDKFNEAIKLLRESIKKDYKKLKFSPNFSSIKKSAQYKKIPRLLKGTGMFGEGGLSNKNKLPIPNNKGKLIARGTFERTDGKLTLPAKGTPNSFKLLKRKDGFNILGFYGNNGELIVGTYVSPGKGTNKINKTPDGRKAFKIKPIYKEIHNGSKYTDLDHISSNEEKSFMMYSIGIKDGYRFHFYTTNGGNISGGCARLPIAYAKKIFTEVRKLEKQGIIPTYSTNKLY